MTFNVKITTEPIEYVPIIESVRRNGAGAINTFMGTTRDVFHDKTVISLSYEAYEPLALKSLNSLVERAYGKYKGIHDICVVHRIGSVPVGDVSVVIAVSSTHRQDGMRAIEDLINWLKSETPIWKKELYADGGEQWKENCECGRSQDHRLQ